MEPHWPYKQAESVPDIESYSLAVGKRLGMNFDAGALGLVWVALLNAGIGIYILRRNPWAPINRAFAFMALAIASWTTAIALTYNTDISPTLLLRLSSAAGSIIPLGVVTFWERFSAASRPTSKRSTRLCAALSVGFALL